MLPSYHANECHRNNQLGPFNLCTTIASDIYTRQITYVSFQFAYGKDKGQLNWEINQKYLQIKMPLNHPTPEMTRNPYGFRISLALVSEAIKSMLVRLVLPFIISTRNLNFWKKKYFLISPPRNYILKNKVFMFELSFIKHLTC